MLTRKRAHSDASIKMRGGKVFEAATSKNAVRELHKDGYGEMSTYAVGRHNEFSCCRSTLNHTHLSRTCVDVTLFLAATRV